jgi:Zn-dependent metalloprotease
MADRARGVHRVPSPAEPALERSTMHHALPCSGHNPIFCVVPPFILEKLAQSADRKVRERALSNLQLGAQIRAARGIVSTLPARVLRFGAVPGPARVRREVYDQGNLNPPDRNLPGKLRRAERGPATHDPAVDEAYNYAGATWRLYYDVFGRNSLDGQGMTLVQSVHAGVDYDNAFWDGRQMVYGDGDGVVFQRFTRAPDVVGHELTHGVVQYTAGLDYQDEPGALNEHFADVFGSLVRQHRKRQSARNADWLIGKEILVPAATRTALRSMKAPGTAYRNDPYLGDDPQPMHYRDRYRGTGDYGGVHINSGIPNHAFYLAATKVGGYAWSAVGKVWYQVMLNLSSNSDFAECARQCREVARALPPPLRGRVAPVVDQAWKAVGL